MRPLGSISLGLVALLSACTSGGSAAAPPRGGELAAPRVAASPAPAAPCRAAPERRGWTSRADQPWEQEIARLADKFSIGVSVGLKGRLVYSHEGDSRRVPASNQKLLLSMALLDELGLRHRIPTTAAGELQGDSVVGDLWLVGRGDPTLTDHQAGYWGSIEATTLNDLARDVKKAGVRRVIGRVMGATDYFGRDLDAPGWQPYVPGQYVQLPASLVLNGNYAGGRDPEGAAAAAFAKELRAVGIEVNEGAGSGSAPPDLPALASVYSPPLGALIAFTNRTSNNFFAEMLGKLLGAEVYGPPGTIGSGARAISRWAKAHGASVIARDSSGLSYGNRISPDDLVGLLGVAEARPWGRALREGLPGPGEGTLNYRLPGLEVRAKTGTLFNGASALSGWVRSRHGRWVAFSILDVDAPKTVEDRIVGIISHADIDAPPRSVKRAGCITP